MTFDFGPTDRAVDTFFKFSVKYMTANIVWIRSYVPATGQITIEHMLNDLYPESATWPEYFEEDFACDKKP